MNHIQNTAERPLVSVIIPAYNAEAFIQKTIESVLQQTYTNLEVIVVDDGSSDRTAEIVQELAQTDSRLQLIQQFNSGVAAARNLAIEKSQGEFIAPIDADDIWYPTNIEKQVQCMLRSPQSVGVVYSWSADIDEEDNLTGEFRASLIEGNVYLALICHNFLGNSSSSLIRRSALGKVGDYSPKFLEREAQGCEDWDLYLRLAEAYEYRVVPELLVGYRKISSSMSCSYRTMAKSHTLMLQSVRLKHPKIPMLLYQISSSSFYLHLARQSKQNHDYESSLFWLKQTIAVDSFTPLLRPGFYALLLAGGLNLAANFLGIEKQFKARSHHHNHITVEEITIERLQEKVAQIWQKVLVGWLIYYSTLLFSMGFEKQENREFFGKKIFKTLI
jgi:glycosyltransferase involved in cell wall biosynthesis